MDPIVRTLDPKMLVVTFAGILITGYAPDTFVVVATEEDFFVKQRGADGTVERYNKNVYDALVTLTLLGTSLSNEALQVLHEMDKQFNTGKGPLLIKDLNGTTIATFAQAWIKKTPDLVGSSSAITREWLIDTGPGVVHIGTSVL